jgi:hypothetical protein
MRRWVVLFSVAILSGCGSHSTATRRTPARGPRGFALKAFAAVSPGDLWVLGLARCHAVRCWAVMRTRDGGRSFTRVSAPPFRTEGVVPSLQFADERSGFAFIPGFDGVLYATHDGGKSWHPQALGDLLAFTTAGGTAYAVTGRCTRDGCTRYRLERAPASSTAWTAAALPFTPDSGLVSLAARGSKVWLLSSAVGAQPHDRVARSGDAGHTFTVGPGPCYSDLGGALSPAPPGVVWAVCPTGMMAGAFRSTDGGATFTQLRTRPLVNSAQLAAASGSTAVLFGNGAGLRPMRTTDGGASWKPARTPSRPIDVFHVVFVDSRVGFALAQTGPERQVLWRTADGGARWSEVRVG